MSNFISVHEALPALNHLVEYKNIRGETGNTRIIMDAERPYLLWLGLNGDSLRTPKYLTHWRYIESDESIRDQEANDWLKSLCQEDEQG